MDTYLKPVIDKLQLLWKRIQMYDISRRINQRSFKYYDILFWTTFYLYRYAYIDIYG